MPLRYDLAFAPAINSTEPSFTVTLSTLSSAHAFETGTTLRSWEGPTGRSIRLSETSGVDYKVQFGTSDVVATSSGSMLVLGGAAELFTIQAGQTHVAFIKDSTTDISDVNVTIGYGR